MFLSHTAELGKYPQSRSFVEAAKDTVLGFQHLPLDMKDFPARDQYPAAQCKEFLQGSRFYVGIIGLRYGSIVKDDPKHSYVELEYNTAKAKGLKRLVYLLDDKAPIPGVPAGELYDDDDEHGEKRQRQRRFRERLQDEEGLAIKHVKTPEDLAEQLTRSLHAEILAEQDIVRSEEPAADNSSHGPLMLARAAQQQLRTALGALNHAVHAAERIEHSYAEPARIDSWTDMDEIIEKHNELAKSATAEATLLNPAFEDVASKTENARKTVEKLREEWPSNAAPDLTVIIDMVSEAQRISVALAEKIEAAQDELRRRAAYSLAYKKPGEALSHAYNLIAEANANTFRMKRALSRSDAVAEPPVMPNSAPPEQRSGRRTPPSPKAGTVGREVTYVGPPPEHIETGLQAAAGEGITPLPEDFISAPVPSDQIRGSEVMAVRVHGDSMKGAGINNGDDVIVRLQPVAEDGDIVVISAWELDDPDPGKARVKRFRQRDGEPRLESNYGDRSSDEAFQPDHHRVLGKVIGIYRRLP